ncbi:MAG: permease [Woeseiaceae bacterium]|nr:permease [Woeseiaceae bacterium]
MKYNKRPLIVFAVIIGAAVTFWSGSRYPSLDEKSIMGGSARLEDPLSFEASIQIQPSDGAVTRIASTTINWLETNIEGMAFGLIIGACLLTLIGLIPARGHRNGFVNALIGVGIGAPLGVCVNCAAPVAKGMHDGGARLESTLATMFSSPTLNIVVISMLFSIFPLYLAVIKLSLTLVFILLLVPLLSRWVFVHERVQTYGGESCAIQPTVAVPSDEGWLAAVRGASITLGQNLAYIVIRTVPLMLLAGFRGAVVVHLMPLTRLLEIEPSILSVTLVALVGIFLPVPVAFDIVLVAVLISAGAPVIYSMTLLFTLGIFSVYPFFIVWNTISARVAVTVAAVLVVMGIMGGVVADRIYQAELQDMLQYLEQEH